MRHIIIIALLFLTPEFLGAQHSITFEVENYEHDTLVVGSYILDKQLVLDTILSEEDGSFVLQDSLYEGVYLVLTPTDNQYLQFLVSADEKEFTMNFDYENKSQISFEGSEDNSVFQYYIDFINEKKNFSDSLRQLINAGQKMGEDISEHKDQLLQTDLAVKSLQDSLIQANPGFMSTLLIKANREIEMPEFDTTDEGRLAQYHYYKDHYFDNIDLSDPRALRSPFYFHRVTYFVDKLTPKNPDSIAQSIDSLMHWMGKDTDAFRYYLSHFLNTYVQSKIVGFDAVYVHLVDNYYANGYTPWVQEENMLKILDRANKLRPVLLGEIGADIQVFKEDGTPISISDIDYEYLVLMFWAPDCGHCKKSMPEFVAFNEKYKEQGIKTFAICTKYREKVAKCWESVEEKNMAGFINGADEFNQSNFKLKYFVENTPKVYILDKNREILMKNIGANQLEAVFEQILKRDKSSNSSSDQ